MSAITAGGAADAYSPGGFNRFSIAQFLAPFDQTAHLCGMTYEEPFVIHDTHRLGNADIEAEANRYVSRLKELVGETSAGEVRR